MKQVFSYLRLSGGNPLKFDGQRAQVRAFCQHKGWEVSHEFLDVSFSGSAAVERFTEIFQAMGRDYKIVVVSNTDRISRDTAIMAEVVKLARRAGVEIFTANI